MGYRARFEVRLTLDQGLTQTTREVTDRYVTSDENRLHQRTVRCRRYRLLRYSLIFWAKYQPRPVSHYRMQTDRELEAMSPLEGVNEDNYRTFSINKDRQVNQLVKGSY